MTRHLGLGLQHLLGVLLLGRLIFARSQIPLGLASALPPSAPAAATARTTAWRSIGPFPIGTREYSILPPFLPSHNQSRFSTALAEGGYVEWKDVHEDERGWIHVGDHQIRWNAIRSSSGWSGLQHRVFYKRTLTIPRAGLYSFRLIGGATEFSILRQGQSPTTTRWHNGNVYSYASDAGHLVRLDQAAYDLTVDYIHDIRVSGEPPDGGVPTAKWSLVVERVRAEVVVGKGRTTVPSLVNGWAMGSVAGVEVRNRANSSAVIEKVTTSGDNSLLFSLAKPVLLAPGQTRLIPLDLHQHEAIKTATSKEAHTVQLSFYLASEGSKVMSRLVTTLTFPIVHSSPSDPTAFTSTFLSNTGAPSYALYTPPRTSSNCSPFAFLALHGAGVDPATATEWTSSIKVRDEEWIVMPLGLSEWGYDWHGPTLRDSFAAIAHLSNFLRLKWVQAQGIASETAKCKIEKYVVFGHSNGGQGAWYFMSHYPDLVLGGVPAAAYVKIQDYVPYHLSVGHHYRDLILTGIMTAGLSSFDNDLYASNLIHLPILARHGSDDDNVPVQHSRQLVHIVQEWSGAAPLTIDMSEVPGVNHWFDSVFRESNVQTFVDRLVDDAKKRRGAPASSTVESIEFTVTTANPDESGSKHGFRILALAKPGRIARIHVVIFDDPEAEGGTKRTCEVTTTNVLRFVVDRDSKHLKDTTRLIIDGCPAIDVVSDPSSEPLVFNSSGSTSGFSLTKEPSLIRRYGPLLSILTTSAPLLIVVGTRGPSAMTEHLRSIASRIASDAYLYGRVDSVILEDREFDQAEQFGNVVLLGDPFTNVVTERWSRDWPVPVSFPAPSAFKIHQRVFQFAAQGFIFLAPHPTSPNSLALVLTGTDALGLERAYRFFPARTGVNLPEWVVSSGTEDGQKGGVEAAGFWAHDWRWSEAMSYI